jgi:dUTP pyrophosphatase
MNTVFNLVMNQTQTPKSSFVPVKKSITLVRGFEQLSSIKAKLPLPKRSTAYSAGYDICVICPKTLEYMEQGYSLADAWNMTGSKDRIVTDTHGVKLPTGIKAYMQPDEYLAVHIRSSMGIKRGFKLSNCVGIIDSDYYNNNDNEGHIKIALDTMIFEFREPMVRICQGIFSKYLVADNDDADTVRNGGIGSTGESYH